MRAGYFCGTDLRRAWGQADKPILSQPMSQELARRGGAVKAERSLFPALFARQLAQMKVGGRLHQKNVWGRAVIGCGRVFSFAMMCGEEELRRLGPYS